MKEITDTGLKKCKGNSAVHGQRMQRGRQPVVAYGGDDVDGVV